MPPRGGAGAARLGAVFTPPCTLSPIRNVKFFAALKAGDTVPNSASSHGATLLLFAGGVKAGGRVVRGLVRRRAEEKQLCMEGV